MPEIQTDYLMTIHAASSGPPKVVNESLSIYSVSQGGWVRGPRVNGVLLQPGADWLRVMPSGIFRVDARIALKTDDDALIYASYNGIVDIAPAAFERMSKGELLTSDDLYFCIAPTFETSHPKYDWLNRLQTVGRVAELQGGSHVRYDIFAVR